jgi:hypothetical protein
LADIDNDGYYEMAVGNERGGLVFYNTIFETNTVSSLDGKITSDIIFSVFPNPANEFVFISSDIDISSIGLYNISGIRVAELSINHPNNISELPAGVYFIRESGQKGIIIRKLVIY